MATVPASRVLPPALKANGLRNLPAIVHGDIAIDTVEEIIDHIEVQYSAVFSGGAGGARAPPEFRDSQKGRSLISAYQSLAITTNTPGFEKLNTAL